MNDLFSVAGKVALVTGGSRGIGAMIARGFVEHGVRTYITARKAEDCLRTAEELSALGDCIAIPCDLSTLDGIRYLTNAIGERESCLHILVNNAGAAWGEPFAAFSELGWDKVVDINLKAPFFLVQQLHALLKQAATAEDPARVINISSINGISHSDAENYSYTASKAGIIHLTKQLARRLAGDNINVNSIAPGFFATKMMAHADSDEIIKQIPRKRAGQPEDAAGAAIYLSSRAAAWMTGITLPVDGGLVAGA